MKDKLEDLYEEWLLNNCKEDIHNKEDLINLSVDGFRYEEFEEEVKKNL